MSASVDELLGVRRKTDLLTSAIRDWLSSRQSLTDSKSERLVDPWRQNPFVRAGVAALYRFVKGVAVQAVTGSKADAESWNELPASHPLAMLLATPSLGVYASELWAQVVAYKKLDGHAFVVLYGADGKFWDRASKKWPAQMAALNTRCVRYDDADVDASGMVTRWKVSTRNGPERIVPAGAMMHLRDFDPRDPIGCSSPLDPVWSGMEADLNIDVYARSWLANVGAVGTWLQAKSDISEPEKKAVLDAFNDAFGGASSAGKTFMSGPDLEIKQGTAQTAKDMEMPRLREWNRDVVKAVLAVTDYEVGRVADYNRANSESARRWLVENTILPELEAIESAFWGHVAEPVSRTQRQDAWLRFKRESIAALRPDLSQTATTAQTLIATGFDPAQVAEKLDLGLDFVDVAQTESTPPVPPVTPVPPVVDTPAPVPPPPPPAKTGPHIWVKRAATPSKPIPRRVALQLQRTWAKHAETKLGVKWRSFTADRYRETIARVREITDIGQVNPAYVDKLMGAAEDWRAGAEAAAKAGLKNLGGTLADNLAAELGQRIDVGQDIFQAIAAKRVGQMVQVGAKLRTRIRDSIVKSWADAGTEGLTVDDLEKVLARNFRGRLPSNAATVARTETGMYAAEVRQSLMQSEGVDEKEWSSAKDQWVRETHQAVDGERKAIDDRFSNGLLHPLESGAPASEVIKCRCVALPRMREVQE